jgi:hypothetical protein
VSNTEKGKGVKKPQSDKYLKSAIYHGGFGTLYGAFSSQCLLEKLEVSRELRQNKQLSCLLSETRESNYCTKMCCKRLLNIHKCVHKCLYDSRLDSAVLATEAVANKGYELGCELSQIPMVLGGAFT